MIGASATATAWPRVRVLRAERPEDADRSLLLERMAAVTMAVRSAELRSSDDAVRELLLEARDELVVAIAQARRLLQPAPLHLGH